MFETENNINLMLLSYAGKLLSDIPDVQLAEQPVPGVNHPAWIIGHVAYWADSVGRLLGVEKALPADWERLFGRGSKPTGVRSDYPSREELLQGLEGRFASTRQAAAAATAEQMGRRNPNPILKDALPEIGDLVAFILTGHLGIHLGQLSMWRRMIGIEPLF